MPVGNSDSWCVVWIVNLLRDLNIVIVRDHGLLLLIVVVWDQRLLRDG